MKTPRPTQELLAQIVGWVRAGCYAHVAAQACGVPRRLYRRWLKRGGRKNAPKNYADFATEINTASAGARLLAELDTYKKDPRTWLEHGPGRERPGDPGWTSSARSGNADQEEDNPLANPELMRLFNKVLKALEPYPEARAHLAAIFAAEPIHLKTDPPKPNSGQLVVGSG
jgi:hypothetical protein